MADSIRELIQKNIDTTLKTISKASNYANDIADVQRFKQQGNSFAKVPVIIQYAGDETKDPGPDPMTSCKFPVYVGCYIKHDSNSDPKATDELINSLLADIEKALMIDVTRGGYAESTFCTSNSIFQMAEGQPYAGIFIEVEIIYNHYRNDPAQN